MEFLKGKKVVVVGRVGVGGGGGWGRGSKFFTSTIDPFQKEIDAQESKQEIMKSISLVQNGGKSTKCIQSS